LVIGEKLPWKLIFKLHAPWLAVTTAMTIGVWVATRQFGLKVPFTPTPFQIAGVALAIFLGFRNNSAYDRWWEGRKLWGGIVNQSRAYGRQVMTLVVAPAAEQGELDAWRKRVLYRHFAWLQALKQQLRGLEVPDAVKPYLSPEEQAKVSSQKNVAAWLVHLQGVELAEAARRGWVTEFRLEMLDRTLTEVISLQGGCERIKSTPIPTAYRVFTHRFTRVYISFLPLGLIEHIQLAAIPVLMLLSLAFLVLETLGRILEDPFTLSPNSLALNAICRTIEINLRQQLGETELPSPVAPELMANVQVLL
jgi:putative membrane protein